MNWAHSLRWALYHRLLTIGVGILGGLIAIAGLWIGLYEVLMSWWIDWPAISYTPLLQPGPAAGTVMTVVGLLLWWIGATAVSYHVRLSAINDTLGERYDTERVKSEVLSVLDSRLEEMHLELETIRAGRSQMDPSSQEHWSDDRLD